VTTLRVRILVNDLSRTGVPILLDRLARWARSTGTARIDVVAIRGGPLESTLARSTDSITVLEPSGRRTTADALAAGAAVLGHPARGRAVRDFAWRRRLRHLAPPDVVVMHGAGAWPLVASSPHDVPLVFHLHELQTGMDRSIPPPERGPLYQRADRILAVCTDVADLARTDGAPMDRMLIVPGVTDGPPTSPPRNAARSADAGPIVAGMGAPGWRKATDRFVALAHELSRTHPTARCVWVGGAPTGQLAATVTSVEPVDWIGSGPDPWTELHGAAVLVVPSREDALPLVALEAAVRRVPVVCAATGGLTDLFADGRGLVVDGFDLRALHAAVADTLDDPDRAAARAQRAQAHVADHYSVDRVGPLWWSAITDAARSHGQSEARR
jgi:glycosyltransferase involved in cell wall biosynthesis